FAAGAGLAGLNRAQETLREALEGLFKPKGQNQRINKALSEFRALQDELKQRQLSTEEWQRHDRSYHETSTAADQIRAKLRVARAEQARLKRVRSAIAPVASHRRLSRELGELGEAIPLRDEFGAEFRAAQDQLRLAEHAITRSRAAIDDI